MSSRYSTPFPDAHLRNQPSFKEYAADVALLDPWVDSTPSINFRLAEAKETAFSSVLANLPDMAARSHSSASFLFFVPRCASAWGFFTPAAISPPGPRGCPCRNRW